jgi:hypothetical protein
LNQSVKRVKLGVQETAGNGWSIVAANIAKNASEYKGEKDVSRMREAIFNKASDK